MQGGGAQFPYPKVGSTLPLEPRHLLLVTDRVPSRLEQEVWSPAGGWWTRPSNWKTNTGFVALGLGLAVYGVWQLSADREVSRRRRLLRLPSETSRDGLPNARGAVSAIH